MAFRRHRHNYPQPNEEVVSIRSLSEYVAYLSNGSLSKRKLNTYRQRFGHSNVDGAVAGGFKDVHGIIQAGSLQVGLVNEHETVPGQQAAIPVGHASRHQGADDQHRLGGVLWVLPSEGSGAFGQWLSADSQEQHKFILQHPNDDAPN